MLRTTAYVMQFITGEVMLKVLSPGKQVFHCPYNLYCVGGDFNQSINQKMSEYRQCAVSDIEQV